MSLSTRIARHDRRRRIMRKLRERGALWLLDPEPPPPLLEFVPSVSPLLRAPVHLAELADAFERGSRALETRSETCVRACFAVPVRHGKTTLVQHAIAWMLRRDPTRRILYVSYAHGFAKKQTARAKEIAQRAGVVLSGSRRKDEWETRAGGFVKGAGIGGQLTGEGFTDVVVDDPHKNRAEAESRVIREGVVEAFFSDVYTRRDPRGTNFYVVHARWNLNDLTGVLTRMDRPFEHHNAPALHPSGEPLAPWLFSRAQLEELRDTLGPYTWASLYQGEPRPRTGALFSDPVFYDASERGPATHAISVGLDLAISTRTRADHNAAMVLRKDLAQGTIDVLEAVAQRGVLTDRREAGEAGDVVDPGFARQVARLAGAYPGARFVMYASENEKPVVALLERAVSQLLEGRRFRVVVLAIESRDKWQRAQRYAASWNGGRVRLPGRRSVREDGGRGDRDGWVSRVVQEHLEFTGVKGDMDDFVDAGAAAHDDLEGRRAAGPPRGQGTGEGSDAERVGRWVAA